MAYESYYWRKIIKREVAYLKNMLTLSHRDVEKDIDKHFSYLEIKIMTLAYIARKLADSNKLPDVALKRKVTLKIHPRTKKEKRAFVDIGEEYNLSKSSDTVLEIREICNQIIHSYVLQAMGTSKRAFRYLLFVSDKKQQLGLFELDIKVFLENMLSIADTHVTTATAEYDTKKGAWIYTKK